MTKKYDVAFSFRTADLATALRLADELSPLTTFVFTRKQGKIVTRDGMDTFGEVFGRQSWLNVVLYRSGYGEQGFTNFEATIIKSRCFEHDGWKSFALFRTDTAPVPTWVPPTYIYGSFLEMSIDTIVEVVRFRAKSAGAAVRTETAADRIERLARKRVFDEETERLATGPEAHAALDSNIASIYRHIEATIGGITNGPLTAEVGQEGRNLGVNLGDVCLYMHYEQQYGRITSGRLTARFFAGNITVPRSRALFSARPPEAGKVEMIPMRTTALGWCWRLNNAARTSEEVAEFTLSELERRAR